MQQLLAPVPVALDGSWGLDHGTWSLLTHAYPGADIPVVQLSIDATRPAAFHFEIGRRLAPARDEGVLILGSGTWSTTFTPTHGAATRPDPYDGAVRFEAEAKAMMVAADYRPLLEYEKLGPDALPSIPTPEHYLPLLYVLGTRQEGENMMFPIQGVEGGSSRCWPCGSVIHTRPN